MEAAQVFVERRMDKQTMVCVQWTESSTARAPDQSASLLWSTGSRACRLQLLRPVGPRVQARHLWCWAAWSHSMCGLPGPGVKPVFPALAGGFLATDHRGSPWEFFLLIDYLFLCVFSCPLFLKYPFTARVRKL